MDQIFPKSQWLNHPFLSKIIVSTDFDGWSKYLNVEHPSAEDYAFAKKVNIEYRINGGEWLRSGFTERQSFITWTSFAWDYEEEQKQASDEEIEWRAVITQ